MQEENIEQNQKEENTTDITIKKTDEMTEEETKTNEAFTNDNPEERILPSEDPLTMTCEDMQQEIQKLMQEHEKYEKGLQNLEQAAETLEDTKLDEIYDTTLQKQKQVDARIQDVFQRFTICQGKLPKQPEPE